VDSLSCPFNQRLYLGIGLLDLEGILLVKTENRVGVVALLGKLKDPFNIADVNEDDLSAFGRVDLDKRAHNTPALRRLVLPDGAVTSSIGLIRNDHTLNPVYH
jgi:hypothetical protein